MVALILCVAQLIYTIADKVTSNDDFFNQLILFVNSSRLFTNG
jgi:hypothetical protein